jgi:hypothetical protein
VIGRGDLILLDYGLEDSYYNSLSFNRNRGWKFGNFYDTLKEFAYVLRDGETELPPKIEKVWTDAVKVRKVFEDNIKAGRTGGETFEILKRKVEEAGLIYVNRQIDNKDLDPDTTQVPFDFSCYGKRAECP